VGRMETASVQNVDLVQQAPLLKENVHGVNYGGRFVSEKYLGLYQTDDVLFKDISSGSPSGGDPSQCDVNTWDAGSRMSKFLDANIKDVHFTNMASLGFNTVRLPLGYWNLIDLPAGATPNGPAEASARWQNLQNFMPASNYMKWIDQIFQWSASSGLKVLLDFHSAPGGQSGNENTGCDLGGDSNTYWDTDWNKQLSLQSIEAMAEMCSSKGSTCWGMELLNEPYGPNGQGISRDSLKSFYEEAIRKARQHLALEVPLVIMDWPDWIASYWKGHASTYSDYSTYGKIVFSTHLYQWIDTKDLQSAIHAFDGNYNDVKDFTSATGFELIFTEYAFNSHGSGGDDDYFDYNGLAQYFVHHSDEVGRGSMVWNFDSYWSAWGPVDHATKVGHSQIDWKNIFATAPPPPVPPTPAPTPQPSPPTTTPAPAPTPSCPGGSLDACMASCSVVTGDAYEICVGVCRSDCPETTTTSAPAPPPSPDCLRECINGCPSDPADFLACVTSCEEQCDAEPTTTPSPTPAGMCCWQDCQTMDTCLPDDACSSDEGSCNGCSGIWCPISEFAFVV